MEGARKMSVGIGEEEIWKILEWSNLTLSSYTKISQDSYCKQEKLTW